MSLSFNQQKLLNDLVKDEKKINNRLYSPGPYWDYKTKKILYWLRKKGLKNFRGSNSGVGTSFTDSIILDIRNEVGFKGRIVSAMTRFPIIKTIFDQQINLTSNYIQNYLKKQQIYLESNEKIKHLISKYKIDDSTEFGCLDKFKLGGKEYSTKYLEMCERIDFIRKFLSLDNIHSFMEIGGGFGANVHIMLQNFKSLKKIFYVDIVPNLFVGTEYLKKFYKESIIDYTVTKSQKKITFKNDNKLEIICIPPWQIENIESKIESFHNSASFQEMSIEQVTNYKKLLDSRMEKNLMSLIIYDGWEKNSTLSPTQINDIFKKKLIQREMPTFFNPKRSLISLTSI